MQKFNEQGKQACAERSGLDIDDPQFEDKYNVWCEERRQRIVEYLSEHFCPCHDHG